jgi:hypothetical protein
MDEYDEIAKGWKWDDDLWKYTTSNFEWTLLRMDEDGNFPVLKGRLTGETGSEFHPSKMAKVLAVGWMEFYERGMKEKGLK